MSVYQQAFSNYARCPGWPWCECYAGLSFPPAEVEAARVRALKRRIRRRIEALMMARIGGR